MKEDYAIIIGINNYTPPTQKGLKTLQGAINDANKVEDWVSSATGGNVPASNYTLSSTGLLVNTTGGSPAPGTWRVTYTTDYAGTACDVNTDLQTEIVDNTSIAGIVLTISLVGIVLTVLIGIFVGMRQRNI